MLVTAQDRKRHFEPVEARRKAWPTGLPSWWSLKSTSHVEPINVTAASPEDLLHVLLHGEFPDVSHVTRESPAHVEAVGKVLDEAECLANQLTFPHRNSRTEACAAAPEHHPWLRVQYVAPIRRFLGTFWNHSLFNEVFLPNRIWSRTYLSQWLPNEQKPEDRLLEYFRILDSEDLAALVEILHDSGYPLDDLIVSVRPNSRALSRITSLGLTPKIASRGLKLLGKDDPVVIELRHGGHDDARHAQSVFVAGFVSMLFCSFRFSSTRA